MYRVMFEPFFSLYLALAGLWIVLAWMSYRAKRQARRQAIWMSEPGCIGNAYELLRRIGTPAADRDQQPRWQPVANAQDVAAPTIMSLLVVAILGWMR
jgi:hypothetical protein